jgi:hypothetical protein
MLHVLEAKNMPESRKQVRHMHLSYEGAADAEEQEGAAALVATVESNSVSEEERELLFNYSHVPAERSKVLLHSCCAPCSGAMVEEMWQKMNLDVTIFFYNPNIHPKKEYDIRKEENKKYAVKHGISFVDAD